MHALHVASAPRITNHFGRERTFTFFLQWIRGNKFSVANYLRMRVIILDCLRSLLLRATVPTIRQQTIAATPTIFLRNFVRSNSQDGTVTWGTKKQHRKVKLNFPLEMTDPKIENELAPLRASVKEQVRHPYGFSKEHVHLEFITVFCTPEFKVKIYPTFNEKFHFLL